MLASSRCKSFIPGKETPLQGGSVTQMNSPGVPKPKHKIGHMLVVQSSPVLFVPVCCKANASVATHRFALAGLLGAKVQSPFLG